MSFRAAACSHEHRFRAPGHTLVELLITLALGSIVLSAAYALLHGYTSLAHATEARAVRNETLRSAAHVLMAETRWLQPLQDVRARSADSLSLRVIRTYGTVCQENPDGTVLTGVTGMRAPDTGKDSLLILRHAEPDLVARLLLAEPHAPICAGHTMTYRLRASAPLNSGDLILAFEAGTYYLSQRALRYRLGAEGRQPLTGEHLVSGSFTATSDGMNAWLSARALRGADESMRVRLPFLGQQP